MKKIIAIAIAIFTMVSVEAQQVKTITLTDGKEAKDVILIQKESKECNINVVFKYDEDKEKITMTLTSFKQLLLFRDDVKYSQVVENHHFMPERLNYMLTDGSNTKYMISRKLRRSIAEKKEYTFKHWLDQQGLTPQHRDYEMAADSVVQEFTIDNHGEHAAIMLNTVVIMEPDNTKYRQRYEAFACKELNLCYNIEIKRNPCKDTAKEAEEAQTAAEGVKKAYDMFIEQYGAMGKTKSEEMVETFDRVKSILQSQFPKHTAKSQCPEVQAIWDKYNTYVDMIAAYNVNFIAGLQSMDAKALTNTAYQIDTHVSRWLVSNDKREKADIENYCKQIIASTYESIKGCTASDDEQQQALILFKKAEKYFKETCKK